MDYQLYLHKTNFFIVLSLLALDSFLYGSQNSRMPLRRQRSEQSEPQIILSGSSRTSLGSTPQEDSPEPTPPNDLDTNFSVYSMVGNKSFVQSKDYHARGFYGHLLKQQSDKIISDFCQTAGIETHDLSQMVDEFQRQFSVSQTNSISSACPIKKFFSDRGYGHTTITVKQEASWGKPVSFTSCKGVTIYPTFFSLSPSSQQAVLYKELQHVVNRDCFYKHIMGEIINNFSNDRQKRKLQNIAEQYYQFMMRRAEIQAGISGEDLVVDVLARESHYALQAPVNYMDELSRMIEQEKKAPMIRAWQKECEEKVQSNYHEIIIKSIQLEPFSDSDDERWTDAEEFNNRLRFTGVDF